MTHFFDDCSTLEELKKSYHAAAMKHHPDRGGDENTMKAINAEYAARFQAIKQSNNTQTTTAHATSESAGDFMWIIDHLLRLDGLEIANTSLAGLGEAFSTSASEANRYHQSADSLMISLLRLAKQNITGAEASTMLSRAMADIYDPSDAAQKALKRLGIEAYTGEGKARDFNDIVNEISASLSEMSDEQANATASAIFSTYGLRAFGNMTVTTTDKLAEFEEGLDSAFGSAAAQAATQLDNLAGDMTLLQSAADGVKLTISSRLSPYLRTFVQWLTGKMPDLETAAGRAIDFVEGKIADLRATIEEFTSSDEWANADIWGKITIAWDKIIAEPFSAWWNSTGKPWLTEKVAGFGATLGSGSSGGTGGGLGAALKGFSASTMTVTAGTVIVNGSSTPNAVRNAVQHATGAFAAAATFFTEDIPQFMTDLWGNVTGFVTETIPQWGRSIGDKISGWWGSISGWFSDLWDGISGSFSAGREAGNAAAGGKHAEGGIMNAPHMAQVAEDGPEAIIPLGASSHSRGMAVWEQAGDILGVGSNDDGLPGANIPLGSGNRSRSLAVWEEAGAYDRPHVGSNDNGLGNIFPEGGPQDVGSGNDVPVCSVGTPGPAEAAQGAAVNAPVSIVLNQENNIQEADKMSAEEVAQILNDRIRGMVDNISDEMAEQLARIFANMPVKGGA